MNRTQSEILPAPPNLIRSLIEGFEVIANHISLILFSVILDVFLWFGPRASMQALFRSYLNWVSTIAAESAPTMVNLIRTNLDQLLSATESFNLFSVLRTLPIGIPSLMSARSPLANPLGLPVSWEINSFGTALIIWFGFLFVGLAIGTFYFSCVAQTVVAKHIDWKKTITLFPGNYIQVILLALFGLLLLVCISLPISCVLPLLLAGSAGIGQIALFVYGVMIIWLLFPLVFAPFGIFVYGDSMWVSLLRGIRLSRASMPAAVLLVLSAFILSQGLGLLWNVPDDNSWLLLVGVFGHAFITTSLLAAFYDFYLDASRFIQYHTQKADL